MISKSDQTILYLTLYFNPYNCQTHSNNTSVRAYELFECVWWFCEVGV